MRDHRDDAAVVIRQRPRDLARREHQPTRSVQDDLDRFLGRGFADRPKHALRVVDVDVACERDPQQAERFLAVDQRNDGRIPLLGDPGEGTPACLRKEVLLDHRLQRTEDEEEPQ